MKAKEFNKVKEGFKEASELLHGKTPKGTTMDVINIHHKSIPMTSVVPHFTPRKIRALRNQLNLSQENFAKVLGVTTSSVRSWEQGQRVPNNSIFHLMKLLKDNNKRVEELVVIK